MNTIQSKWEDLSKKIFHPDIPEIQVKEMRKAFYLGAFASLSIMLNISDENFSEEAGAKVIENLRQECINFFRRFE